MKSTYKPRLLEACRKAVNANGTCNNRSCGCNGIKKALKEYSEGTKASASPYRGY